MQVCTIALNSGLAANPIGFKKVWEDESGVALWFPVPPESYAAVGCMATVDGNPPPTTSCLCLHVLTLVETSVSGCVWRQPPSSIWRIENAARTFTVSESINDRPKGTMNHHADVALVSMDACTNASYRSEHQAAAESLEKYES